MNTLILGSGGREHAFARAFSKSEICGNLFVAPGNAGTAQIATNLSVNVDDFDKLKTEIIKHKISFVVVGPELPLVKGFTDMCKQDPELQGVKVVGPAAYAAQLEGSKEFAKDFMVKYGIPTAAYQAFTKDTVEEGKQFLSTLKAPYVLKADGLAAGKGVLILDSLEEAQVELEDMLLNEAFGEASQTVVIEEFLSGIELSVFVLTNGKEYKILPNAKDYKRIGEGDTGLNTGGMGAVSPVPFATDELLAKIEEKVVKPTIKGIQETEMDYTGFVFIGLMITPENEPYVIEYNVRMGDPESEVVLPRIESDLLALLKAATDYKLEEFDLKLNKQAAATVMLVSGGYPEKHENGKEIIGWDEVQDSIVYHGGTKLQDGKVLTNGGRVMAITSLADSYAEAVDKSYKSIKEIKFDKMYYRTDIGKDLA